MYNEFDLSSLIQKYTKIYTCILSSIKYQKRNLKEMGFSFALKNLINSYSAAYYIFSKRFKQYIR